MPKTGKHLIPMADALEQDAFTAWRHLVSGMARAGLRKYAKRKYSKRQRRALKRDTQRRAEEWLGE